MNLHVRCVVLHVHHLEGSFLRGEHADCSLDKRVLDLHATNTG
jgi:hypothetical protein